MKCPTQIAKAELQQLLKWLGEVEGCTEIRKRLNKIRGVLTGLLTLSL